MLSLIIRMHKNWMQLDPSKQLMAWSACGVIVSGLLAVVFAFVAPMVSGEYFGYVKAALIFGVLGLLGIFVAAILFLTVIWPKHFEKSISKDS